MHNPFKDLPKHIGELRSSPIMRRCESNPILTASALPYPGTLVFNAGVARYRGRYYIAPRVDHFAPGYTRPALDICTAFGSSTDGINFTLEQEPVRVHYKGQVLPWV